MYLWNSLLIVPEFATFISPWAVTRPRQFATSVLTKLWSLLLLYSCSAIHPSPKIVLMLSPSSPNGSPGIVVEVFLTWPIDWQETVGGGWFGHPSVLRLLAIWWAICCFQEVKDYHISTGFSSCPQGKKHMDACKVVTKKVIPLSQASCRSQWPSPSHLLPPENWYTSSPSILRSIMWQEFRLPTVLSLFHMLKPTFVCLFINILKPST